MLIKCLAKDPGQRYYTATEFVTDLERAIAGYENLMVIVDPSAANPASSSGAGYTPTPTPMYTPPPVAPPPKTRAIYTHPVIWLGAIALPPVGYFFQSTYHTDNPRRLPKPRFIRKQQKNQREISGFVFFAGRPLSGVAIRNYSRNAEVVTDARGRYRLKLSKGDVLGISYPGLESLIVEVEEPKNFNFQMHAER